MKLYLLALLFVAATVEAKVHQAVRQPVSLLKEKASKLPPAPRNTSNNPTQLTEVIPQDATYRRLEPVSVGIAVGVGVGVILIGIDGLLLKALYYGIGVARVDDTPAVDDDTVTRAGYLFESYVDWNADKNIPGKGHAHEERHYYIPFQDWSAVYPIREWVLPQNGFKAERGWKLFKKGNVIAKGKGRRKDRVLEEVDPNFTFRLAEREDTAINFTTSMEVSKDDIQYFITIADNFDEGTSEEFAEVEFSQSFIDYLESDTQAGSISWGLNPGVDVETVGFPDEYVNTILDIKWEAAQFATFNSDGMADEEISLMAVTALRLVVGDRAGPEWILPEDLEVTVDDVIVNEEDDTYVVSKTITIYLHDIIEADGNDGVYLYDYTGPGKPDSSTPLPEILPEDAVDYTLYGADSGGSYAISTSVPTVSPAPTGSPSSNESPASPMPTECLIPRCCEEDCCRRGTSFLYEDGRCVPDASSIGWTGTYSDMYVEGCVLRTCCEGGCCSDGTVWVELLGYCIGAEYVVQLEQELDN